ncbi:MAG: VOC family protein [Anaerolineae bacterium]|nr:VOC family protein [Anaerolineae bacterium]
MSKQPVAWLEVAADDRLALAKFYSDLFGWKYADFADNNYTTLVTGSVGIGINQRTPDNPGAIAFYAHTTDIDADLEKANRLGGQTAVPKMPIPGDEYIAFLMDPQSNLMGLGQFKSTEPQGTSGRPVVWLEMAGSDRVALAEFYAGMFGWTYQDYPNSNYTTLDTGSTGLGLMTSTEENPGGTSFYIHSEDIEGDLARITAAGGKVMMEKTYIPGTGWFAFFMDPAGNAVAVADFREGQQADNAG